jgi:hypothetical protein
MNKYLEASDYFDDEQAKARYPQLFEDYVGKYLSDAEIALQQRIGSGNSLSAQLMVQLERQIERFELF